MLACSAPCTRRSPPMPRTETAKPWTPRLRRFDQTDTTVADFCASESVSQASFYDWKRRLRRRGPKPIASRPLRSCPSRWGNSSIGKRHHHHDPVPRRHSHSRGKSKFGGRPMIGLPTSTPIYLSTDPVVELFFLAAKTCLVCP
jgi:hypothetical protein